LTAAIYPTKNVLDQKQLEGRSFSTRTRPWPKKILKAAIYQKKQGLLGLKNLKAAFDMQICWCKKKSLQVIFCKRFFGHGRR